MTEIIDIPESQLSVKMKKLTVTVSEKLTGDFTLANGVIIQADGTIIRKDGTRYIMKAGDCVDWNGDLLPPAQAKRGKKGRESEA